MKHLIGIFLILLTMTFGLLQIPSEVSAAEDTANQVAATQISINSADADLLTQIPGIGPKTAEEIIKYRNSIGKIKNLDELLNVKGIGEKKLAKLKPYMTL